MKRITLPRHLAWREVGGQVFIINTQDSMLHELDEIGSFIWKALAASKNADDVLKKILETYETEPQTARADLDEFLSVLGEKGLIEFNETLR